MLPEVYKGQLCRIPERRRKTICQCDIPCKFFITIVGQEDFVLCEKIGRNHALDILSTLGVITDIKTVPTPFWTTKEEKFVIDYFKKHGQHNGAYRIIGVQLGRSRDAVKNKVRSMKKEGKIAC